MLELHRARLDLDVVNDGPPPPVIKLPSRSRPPLATCFAARSSSLDDTGWWWARRRRSNGQDLGSTGSCRSLRNRPFALLVAAPLCRRAPDLGLAFDDQVAGCFGSSNGALAAQRIIDRAPSPTYRGLLMITVAVRFSLDSEAGCVVGRQRRARPILRISVRSTMSCASSAQSDVSWLAGDHGCRAPCARR